MPNVLPNFVYNSITNDIVDEEKRDIEIPFSLLNFLKYTGADTNELNEIALYQEYLQTWQDTTDKKIVDEDIDLRNQFIIFLKEIRLQYLNLEEQRYLDNINFENNQELSVAIPFFATKIKDIALYYKSQRDKIGLSLENVKRKGSLAGIKRFLSDQIGNIYAGEDQPDGLTIPNDIPEFLKNLVINVDPVFDNFNDYYDLDPSKTPVYYNTLSGNRFKYFSSNTNNISANFYINTEAAINDIINNNGIELKEVPGLLVKFKTSDLSFTQAINYETYKNTGLSANLSFLKQREIAINNMGTDMYYISTNSTPASGKGFIYNKLFDASNPQRNLLNINHPTTIQMEGDNFVSERDVGLFYSPIKRGILSMTSKFSNILVPANLKPNKVYIFPDPNSYGNVEGLGVSKRENPLVFTLLDKSIKKNVSSSFGKGLPKSTSINQNFYSYTSIEKFDKKINNLQPLKTIQSLTSAGFITKESGDIFGNKFYHFKNTDNVERNYDSNIPLALGPDLRFRGPAGEGALQTELQPLVTSTGKDPISFIRTSLKPIIVYNVKKNNLQNLNVAFDGIFGRYIFNKKLYYDFSNNLIADINIFRNTYFFKTSSFYVIDTVDYDAKKGIFKPSSFVSVVKTFNTDITTRQDIKTISNISNPFEVDKDIFYVEIQSNPNTTVPINVTHMKINIFKYDRELKRELNLVTTSTQAESFFANNFTFDVGSKITQISNIELKFNSKQSKFACITNFRDLNNVSFIHVLTFKIFGNTLTIFDNYVIGPNNFNTTKNFYELNEFANTFATVVGEGNLTTPKQKVSDGTLRF